VQRIANQANDLWGKRLENTKPREVLETAAAFANTEGGHIDLGVNDACIRHRGFDPAVGKFRAR
jgi:predicted HTH transcriptional regulator